MTAADYSGPSHHASTTLEGFPVDPLRMAVVAVLLQTRAVVAVEGPNVFAAMDTTGHDGFAGAVARFLRVLVHAGHLRVHDSRLTDSDAVITVCNAIDRCVMVTLTATQP